MDRPILSNRLGKLVLWIPPLDGPSGPTTRLSEQNTPLLPYVVENQSPIEPLYYMPRIFLRRGSLPVWTNESG
jgi:hypothetical protein